MAELEEPGWPNLQSGPPPGQTFLRAFAAVSQINGQKRKLEEQIMKMDMQERMSQQKHDLDIEKFGWQQEIQTANLNRAYDAMHQTAVFADRRAHDAEGKATWSMQRADAKAEDASTLRRQLSEAAGKNPIWSQAFHNDMIGITSHFSSSKEIEAVIKDFNTDISRATSEAHKNANQARMALNASLGMQSGSGLSRQDLQRPDSDFVRKDGNINIAESPVTVPGPAGQPASIRWQVIPGSEYNKLGDDKFNKKYPGVRWRRSTESNFQNFRDLHDTYMKYGGDQMSDKPAVKLDQSTEVTRNVNGRKAVFDSGTKQFVRWDDE